MALFLFAESSSNLSSLLADQKVSDLKSQTNVLTHLISIAGSLSDEDISQAGISADTAQDMLDGALLMKKFMDQEKILEAKCFFPQENQPEFESIIPLIFPAVCNISVESYSGENSPKPWKSCSCDDFSVTLKRKLSEIETNEPVETVQSRLIPSDRFIHGYTKRYGGISNYPGMDSLNLVYSTRKPDSIFVVKENARRFCESVGVAHEKYHLAKANHGNKVWVFEDTPPDSYDGIVTNTKGVTVASPAADCNMLLLADNVTKSCGAIHAGWKGILAGIVESAVNAMVSAYGSNPEDIKATLGPSLSVCCCEFGAEDSKKFEGIGKGVVVWLEGKEKPHIDLRLATTILLQNCGIKEENIDDGIHGPAATPEIATCTKCDPNKDFFSYRRDGPKFGNQVAYISLK